MERTRVSAAATAAVAGATLSVAGISSPAAAEETFFTIPVVMYNEWYDRCLDGNGTPGPTELYVSDCGGERGNSNNPNHVWLLVLDEDEDEGDGLRFVSQNANNGTNKMLDGGGDGAYLHPQWMPDNPLHRWRYIDDGDGKRLIQNVATGNCLNVGLYDEIYSMTCIPGNPHQQFRTTTVGPITAYTP